MPFIVRRRPGEKFHIGPNITVTVLERQGRQVALAVHAPDYIQIQRPSKEQDAVDREIQEELTGDPYAAG